MTWLILGFFFIALVYASVGFGGGSSYIALLLVAGLAVEEVRLLALMCNVIVVTGGVLRYYRAGLIDWRQMLPLVALSVPLAYLGGTIRLSGEIYQMLAGVALLIASFLLIFRDRFFIKKEGIDINTPILSAIGGGIGFLSGLIGIGGGIFLSPVLHLMRWQTARVISAAASLFILANSLAGLLGQIQGGAVVDISRALSLGAAVLIGGQIGSHMSIHILKASYIRLLTAVLIAAVGIRLLIQSV